MSDQHYPIDIHGCAQGVITFSLQQKHQGDGRETCRARVLDWTLANMWDPTADWFYYQQRRCRRHLPNEDPGAALVPGLDVVGARLAPRDTAEAQHEGLPGP